jgi:beta-lactamase class A
MRRRSFLASTLAALSSAQRSYTQNRRATPKPLELLRTNIESVTQSANARWGIYIKCIETSEEISINADAQMDTMSVIKLPLMAEVFRQIEAGKFKLTDRVTLGAEDKRPGTGVIRSMDDGIALTIHDLLTLMIIVSDNTATDLLFRQVGGIDPVNALARDYGLTQTRAVAPTKVWFDALRASPSVEEFYRKAEHPFGLSSPKDIGLLLEKMEKGTAVSKSSSAAMLAIMRGQVYRTRLPKYVNNFVIPHKTGDFLPYIGNDVGVFESPQRRVIVSVFTADHFGSGALLEDAIGRIGQQVADYFSYRD